MLYTLYTVHAHCNEFTFNGLCIVFQDAKTVCDMIKMCAPSKTVQLAAVRYCQCSCVGDNCMPLPYSCYYT